MLCDYANHYPLSILPKYNDDVDHFRHVFDYLINPAIKNIGFEAIPPTAEGSDVIQGSIIRNLETADLVLCDMSSLNPNVLFELGIRTALNKSVSLIKDNLTPSIPFDPSIINHHTYISALEPWILEDQIPSLTKHLEKSIEKSDDSNSLRTYFSFSMRAESIKGKEGDAGFQEFLALELDGIKCQLAGIAPRGSDDARFRDYAVDQNRSAVIADLTALAAKAQQYYTKPATLTGGCNSFAGLTADASGLVQLASTAFTDNANGTYTIKTSGTATTIVLHGVGKAALNDGTFPTMT